MSEKEINCKHSPGTAEVFLTSAASLQDRISAESTVMHEKKGVHRVQKCSSLCMYNSHFQPLIPTLDSSPKQQQRYIRDEGIEPAEPKKIQRRGWRASVMLQGCSTRVYILSSTIALQLFTVNSSRFQSWYRHFSVVKSFCDQGQPADAGAQKSGLLTFESLHFTRVNCSIIEHLLGWTIMYFMCVKCCKYKLCLLSNA